MKFRHPLIAILFVGVLLTATLVAFIAAKNFKSDARATRQASVTHLLDAVQSWSVSLNRSLSDELTAVIEKEWNTHDVTPEFSASEFKALALVTQNTSGAWNVDWWRSRDSGVNRDWAQSVLQQASGFPIKTGEVFWQRVLLPNQQVLFAIAVPMKIPNGASYENKIAVGFAGPGLFALAPFADPTGNSELFVVDQRGVAVGYPEAQYVGSKIDDHPVVANLMSAPSTEKIIEYSVGYKKAVGGYEHVPGSNLYVVATKTLPDWVDVLGTSMLTLIEVAVVMAILLCMIAAMALGLEQRERALLKENLRLAQAKASSVAAVSAQQKPAESSPVEREIKTTNDDGADLLRGVVDFMRGYTTAMAGFVQLLETHLAGSGANIKAVNVHRQLSDVLKTVREFVESLGRNVQSAELKIDAVDFPGLLNAVIAVKKPNLAKQNIQVEDNFQPDLRVTADFVRLKTSLTTLLGFAGDYLSEAEPDRDRRIRLHAQRLGGMVQLRIEVRGRELAPDIRRKLFAPFQVVKSKNKRGLELALAKARINEMNGDVTIESTGFEGFEIVCKIPAAVGEMPAELKAKEVPQDIAELLPPTPDESKAGGDA